jgi:hypothetical protein
LTSPAKEKTSPQLRLEAAFQRNSSTDHVVDIMKYHRFLATKPGCGARFLDALLQGLH